MFVDFGDRLLLVDFFGRDFGGELPDRLIFGLVAVVIKSQKQFGKSSDKPVARHSETSQIFGFRRDCHRLRCDARSGHETKSADKSRQSSKLIFGT